MRAAIYFAPAPETALWQAGCAWLGRDALSGERNSAALDLELGTQRADEMVSSPRRYGFHATLKAPFALREPLMLDGIERTMQECSEALDPVEVALQPEILSGFVALVPTGETSALRELASSIVELFEPFRAPFTDAEFARRSAGLDDERVSLLARWGYPHVFEHFRFHMTLTGCLSDEDASSVLPHARAHFAESLSGPIAIDRLTLFVEPEPGADFVIRSAVALGGGDVRNNSTDELETTP